MTKSELVSAISEKSGLNKKQSEEAVKAFTQVVTDALSKGESVQLVGFGTFEVRERAAREGRNPQTKAVIKVPATKVPAFKAGKSLKDEVASSKAAGKKKKK